MTIRTSTLVIISLNKNVDSNFSIKKAALWHELMNNISQATVANQCLSMDTRTENYPLWLAASWYESRLTRGVSLSDPWAFRLNEIAGKTLGSADGCNTIQGSFVRLHSLITQVSHPQLGVVYFLINHCWLVRKWKWKPPHTGDPFAFNNLGCPMTVTSRFLRCR